MFAGTLLSGSPFNPPSAYLIAYASEDWHAREVEVWRRLLSTDFPQIPVYTAFASRLVAESVTPASRYATTIILEEPHALGAALVTSDQMISTAGAPVESIYEPFTDQVREILSRPS